MDARRLLTARAAGGVAVGLASLVAAVGFVGFGSSIASPDALDLLPPVAAAIVLVVAILWIGGSPSGAERTPYW